MNKPLNYIVYYNCYITLPVQYDIHGKWENTHLTKISRTNLNVEVQKVKIC